MDFPIASLQFSLLTVLALAGVAHHDHGHGGGADGFHKEIAEGVIRMHVQMDLPFTGNADHDFARMMIPHHQGAIDMALAELRYGKDERLKRLAQEIIVDQQQEIAVMHLALGDLPGPGAPSPTDVAPAASVQP